MYLLRAVLFFFLVATKKLSLFSKKWKVVPIEDSTAEQTDIISIYTW